MGGTVAGGSATNTTRPPWAVLTCWACRIALEVVCGEGCLSMAMQAEYICGYKKTR